MHLKSFDLQMLLSQDKTVCQIYEQLVSPSKSLISGTNLQLGQKNCLALMDPLNKPPYTLLKIYL